MQVKDNINGIPIGAKIHKYRDEIKRFCSSFKRIHLYGIGCVAENICEAAIQQ